MKSLTFWMLLMVCAVGLVSGKSFCFSGQKEALGKDLVTITVEQRSLIDVLQDIEKQTGYKTDQEVNHNKIVQKLNAYRR